MIKPQVSMPVLYHPHPSDHFGAGQPLAAIIARVWGGACVNLTVFDGNGLAQNVTSVLLWQGTDCPPAGGRWCQFPEWFARFMAPPLVTFGPNLIAGDAFDTRPINEPAQAYYVGTATARFVPAGTPDKVQL
jgi:hypothetical protein